MTSIAPMNGLHRLARLDLNLLVVFDAVYTERSVHKAAARLGVTQPAVSHALARLREHLGDPLFIKAARGVLPTARATELGESLRRSLEAIDSAVYDTGGFDPARAQRTFTLNSADYAECVLLPGLVRLLARQAPGVHLRVRAPTEDVFSALESGALDLALGLFREAPAAFRRQTLFSDRFVCLVRKGHPLGRRPLTLERYLELSHITVAPMGSNSTLVDAELVRQGRERRIALTVPQFLIAPLIVAETDLALMLPERIGRRYARMLKLRMLKPPIEVESFTISQLWHERLHNDPAHAWLRQCITRVL